MFSAAMIFAVNATAQGQRPTLAPGPGLDLIHAQIALQTQLVAAQTRYLDGAQKISETPDFRACRANDRLACARMNVRFVEIQNELSLAKETFEGPYRLAIARAELQIASLSQPAEREFQIVSIALVLALAAEIDRTITRDIESRTTALRSQLSQLGPIDPLIQDFLVSQLIVNANLRTRSTAIQQLSSRFGTATPTP